MVDLPLKVESTLNVPSYGQLLLHRLYDEKQKLILICDMSSATHGVVLPVSVDEHGEGAVDGRVLGDGDLALEGPSHLYI